jgi:transcriptional regulator with XRE-family HTH domain
MANYDISNEEKSFADWLDYIMTKNEITQTQLAIDLSTEERKVNRSTISLWLSDQRLPSADLRAKLAKHLSELGIYGYSPMIREILWRVHVSEMRRL